MFGVQEKLVKIRNELRAQKVAGELAYSSMLMPENTPSATYTGTVDLTTVSNIMARLAITFTRSDGKTGTPFAQLTFDTTVNPTYADWVRSIGGTVTGRDPDCELANLTDQYVASTTDTSITYNVDFGPMVQAPVSSATISVTAKVISNVPGTLTITRAI